MIIRKILWGVLAAMAAGGTRAADPAADAAFKVSFDSCPKCPCRLRIASDGRSATVNLARLQDDSPSAEKLASRKAAIAARARKLMRMAEATRAGDRSKRPLMGWSSWNTFAVEISEDIILSVARAMHTNGLQAAGYTYVNIDDGFFNGRDAEGHLRFHPRRFPNGLKGTVDGIHALGLRAGTYSDAGINTCGSIWNGDTLGRGSGLYGHDADDLTLHFNALGFDFIKVDYCGAKEQKLDERARYTEIARALRATGRADARLNLCRWAFPGAWAAEIAESWRTTRDIRANWTSVKELAAENFCLSAYVSPGHYNDLDMLEVGLPKGCAATAHKGDEGLTPEEELTHFGLWCIMSSPLLIGCDARKMPAESIALVTNPFLLAMNQNDLGLAASPVRRDGDAWVLAKDADTRCGTARFVALYNAGEQPHDFDVAFAELDLGGKVEVFDLVERTDLGVRTERLTFTVPAHATRFLRLDAGRRLERVRYEAECAFLSEYQELRDARAAGTAFYRADAAADAGHVVANLGGRASNDMIWQDVRVEKAGVRTLVFRVRTDAACAFQVQVDGDRPQTVKVGKAAGRFQLASVRTNLSAGSHRVRVFCAKGFAPEFDWMELGPAPVSVTVDWSAPCGPVKPVNAVGQPPMIGSPKNFWMFKYLKEAGIPYSRLHDVGGNYSPLFNPLTYKPHKAYCAFTAFNELRKLKTAVKVTPDADGDVWACAAAKEGKGAVMVANASDKPRAVDFRFGSALVRACRITDADRTDAAAELPDILPPYSFAVVVTQ